MIHNMLDRLLTLGLLPLLLLGANLHTSLKAQDNTHNVVSGRVFDDLG